MPLDHPDELFAVLPADFVKERKALVSALRAAGRREEASTIAARPRPSVATWATNRLARDEPASIRKLGEVTDRLRAAERSLLGGAGAGADYSSAVAEHRDLLKSLRAKAEAALGAAGLRSSPQVLAQVSQNLRAGLAGAKSRPLVESGRLLQDIPVTEGGLFEPVADAGAGTPGSTTAEATATSERPSSKRAAARERPTPVRARGGQARADESAREREVERARERTVAESARREREARAERAALEQEVRRILAGVEMATSAREKARSALDAAEATLAREERTLAAARQAVASAHARLDAARATLDAEAARLSDAEEKLASLGKAQHPSRGPRGAGDET